MSIIYKSIHLYRFVMNLLYRGAYRGRFVRVADFIVPNDHTVLELCFGDTYVAKHCRSFGKRWIGYDISEQFVAYARRKGFDARQTDISQLESFPESDVSVMVGFLYHFYPDIQPLLKKILRSAPRFILSEPIVNWTNQGGLLSSLARMFTSAGKGHETFRFDEVSLIETLNALKKELSFDYRVVHKDRDMVIEIKRSS